MNAHIGKGEQCGQRNKEAGAVSLFFPLRHRSGGSTLGETSHQRLHLRDDTENTTAFTPAHLFWASGGMLEIISRRRRAVDKRQRTNMIVTCLRQLR